MDNLYNKTIKIMKKYNVVANKSFGQNFLIDENIVESIVEKANIGKDDFVIEIGPGLGTLTEYLLKNAGKVLAVELDKKMVNIITDRFSEEINSKNLEVLCDDILKVNLREIIKKEVEAGYKRVKVVANLPYYITTPIIMKLLEEKLEIESITVMIQKEVANRIAEIPGGKETGAITYTVYYYADTKILLEVPRDSFIPEPEVTSAVIQFNILKSPRVNVDNEEEFFKLIKQSFLMKRKTLVNALVGYKNKEKQDIINVLQDLGINEKVRAEQLTLEQFVKIYNKILKG